MRDLLSDQHWLAASHDERRSFAEALVARLPRGFRFAQVGDVELGERRRPVATFVREGRHFALVPGGQFTVGFGGADWVPNAEELASYGASAEEYGLERSLVEAVTAATRPRRSVDVPALLVETTAEEVGWATVDPTDPDVQEAVEEMHPGPRVMTLIRSGSKLRISLLADGTVQANAAMREPTHAAVAHALAEEGFRLPTADEWEYLCSGGADTLFRWGDHAPSDRYPTDMSPEEAAWRKEWALSGGTLERPAAGFAWGFDLHRRPNALGLQIAFDPYKNELVAEADMTRGGDGGASACGGVGFFLGWLPLSSAYFDEETCRREASAPVAVGYAIGRRVLTLPR